MRVNRDSGIMVRIPLKLFWEKFQTLPLLYGFRLFWNPTDYIRQCFPLQICSMLRGSIAERGGVRVGHRIIEINGSSMVDAPHENIVNSLTSIVGKVGTTVQRQRMLIFRKELRIAGGNVQINRQQNKDPINVSIQDISNAVCFRCVKLWFNGHNLLLFFRFV